MDVEMRIRGLMMDPNTNMPIVILKDVNSDTVLPIWVGLYEAQAIHVEFEKLSGPRPLTHDLAKNLINYMNGKLERVVITELKDDTFYAVLWLTQGGEPMTVDARPSDAIALALRADCPIYVAEPVLGHRPAQSHRPAGQSTAKDLREWLEGLNDEDLGRYKM
jgi:bifunctional DNase/RNase